MASSGSIPAPFSPYIGELNTLSSLPPNTFFHRNRDGHFIATADFAANVSGAQTVANTYKGRSPQDTAIQISKFSQELLRLIEESVSSAQSEDDELLCRKTFRQIIFVCQRINLAIRGRVEDGGLGGAPKTYSGYGESSEQIAKAIREMKEGAFKALKTLRDKLPEKPLLGDEKLVAMTTYCYDPDEKPECPEEKYTDEEWEQAIIQSANLKKELVGMLQYYGRYSIGLLYNQMRSYISSFKGTEDTGWDWYNKIGDYENASLFLSALPVKSSGTDSLADMKRENIGAVLSVTEVFETLSEGYITTPISPKTYAENGIKHLQIPTPDCETIFFELVLRGVEFVHWCLSNGISVDVHCKAGRGRSFMIVVGYLIKYQGMTAEDAFAHVQKMRPQSGFNKSRAEWNTLLKFEEFYLKK